MFELSNSFIELLMALVFIFSASIMFLSFGLAALRSTREHKREYREEKPVTPHIKAITPIKPEGTTVKTNIIEEVMKEKNSKENRTIRLEIEFPELPERITIPFEKLPELLSLLGTSREEHHKIVVQGESEEEKAKERKSWSAMKYHDRPWLDILSRVSGLEFSEDGEKVYCPRHGWTYYIVASDGRILCGEGKETLWDPNKERYRPPDRRELMKLQKELMDVKREIGELQHIAEMRPPRTKTKPREEAREEYIEEEYEEEPEEEETEA